MGLGYVATLPRGGTTPLMDRNDLLRALTSAATPHQTSSAMSEARSWLADNPDDEAVREAVQHLARMERERWGLSSAHR